MIDRRTFLTRAAVGGAALSVLPWQSLAHAAQPQAKVKKLGFISGILKNELQKDWKAALKTAAGYGFTEIETGNYQGDSRADFLAFLKDIGLKINGGGAKISQDMGEAEARLDELAELGIKNAVLYWPWLVGAPFSLDDCKTSVELMNKIGERAKARGMQLCWHNHDKEFWTMEWGLPFDYLMQHTEPELVQCEMDVYWVAKGGADPVTMLKKYEGRYVMLHIKDVAEGEEKAITCPGDGILDFAAIFKEAYRQDINHFNVERDNAVDGLGCLKASSEHLLGLRW